MPKFTTMPFKAGFPAPVSTNLYVGARLFIETPGGTPYAKNHCMGVVAKLVYSYARRQWRVVARLSGKRDAYVSVDESKVYLEI